ncbi:crAss001_48 related protein [Limosilactobacillus reuteri]|uniref:crAss001_48 related protein n=1 Tax=Limosilactobacillus reuteri TaxID=1598 RepID=UPI003D76B9A2
MTTKQKNMLIKELQEERRELLEKINRLRLFLDHPHSTDETEEYVGANSAEMYWVLEAQFRAMMQYKAALSERIGLLKNSYKGYEEEEL